MTTTVHTEAGPGFTVPLAEFTAAVNALSVAVATRPPLPLLGGVLITRDANGLRLSTFDYETSITVALDSEPGVPSAVLVSLAELRKVLKAATKGETARSTALWQVQFASAVNTGTRMEHRSEEYGYRDGARVTTREAGKIPVDFRNTEAEVTVGGFTVPLATLPDRDYPKLPDGGPSLLTVDQDLLLAQMDRATVAAGRDVTLPMLRCVQLELNAGALTLACTDRFRLAALTIPVAGEQADGSWNVPADQMSTLVKAMPAGELQLGLPSVNPYITVRSGNVTATLRLSDTEFPRWRQLIPAGHDCTVRADRAALLRCAVKAGALSAALDSRLIWLTAQQNKLTVTPDAGTEHQGRVRGTVVPCAVDGPGARFGFTGSHLIDALKSFDDADIHIGLGAGSRAVLLVGDGEDLVDSTATHRHLLVPARQPGSAGVELL